MFGSLAIAIVIPNNQINLVAGLMEAFRNFFQLYHLMDLAARWPFCSSLALLQRSTPGSSGLSKDFMRRLLHGNLPPLFQKTNKHEVPTDCFFSRRAWLRLPSLVFLYMPAVSSSFWILTALSAQSYAIMYVLMFIAALRLRYFKPDVERTLSRPLPE